MEFGLPTNDVQLIRNVFASIPKIREVILFGSRAMGNFKPGSDIDLAIIGDAISFNDVLDISNKLDHLEMLYTFDLQNMSSIKDEDVIKHIKRLGMVFYEKQ